MKKVAKKVNDVKSFVAYYRVSTQKQGNSGLGLDGQRAAVEKFIGDGILISEHTEIESGKKTNRVELLKAIETAKKHGSTLVIAKLDRLARNAYFVMQLQNEKVPFVCVDNPHANELTINILAVMAQHEAKAISERTKAALTAKVERLKANGEPTNWRIDSKTGEIAKWTNEARAKGIAAVKEKAANNENIQRAKDVAKMLRESGNTLIQIADYLNKRKFTTSKGMQFQKTSVLRLLA